MRLRRIYSKNRKGDGEWNRVRRGGYWNNSASDLRAVYRYNDGPSYQNYSIGARLFRRIRRQR